VNVFAYILSTSIHVVGSCKQQSNIFKSTHARICFLILMVHSQKKLSLGLYLFKRYTFVPKGCILVP